MAAFESKNNQSIKNLLKANYVDGSVFHTHVSLIEPRGRFAFNKEQLEVFWDNYCKMVQKRNNSLENDIVFGIAEKSQDYMPVLVDVDLKIKDDGELYDKIEQSENDSDRLYTNEQLLTIIGIYQSTLRTIIDECTEETLICVVLEKDPYRITKGENSWIKHGFHLHFPNCFITKNNHSLHLIPRVKADVDKCGVFDNLGFEKSSMTIDDGYTTAPWLLYGSQKNPESKRYTVTKIYNADLENMTLQEAFGNYQIYDNKEKLIRIKDKVEFYLPRILSILPYNRETKEVKKTLISPLKEKIKFERKQVQPEDQKTAAENIALAKNLMPLVADFRATDYNEWIHMGWLLYNISEGDNEGFELWNEFSSRDAEKYDEGYCLDMWNKMIKKDTPTIATLKYYAKADNPLEYRKFKTELNKEYLLKSIEGASHFDAAKILYNEYADEFICGSIVNKLWFKFNGNNWEVVEDGVDLRKKITEDILKMYEDSKAEIKRLKYNDGQELDKSIEAMYDARLKSVTGIITHLKNNSWKNGIMKEAMDIFYDKKFSKKLDTDKMLFPFKNGVYDLRINQFRKGRPEDYISKTCGCDFEELSFDDEKVIEVLNFFEKIFPDKELRKYFYDNASDVFEGGNKQKTVIFWTGDGDNGKSVAQKLFECMLGTLAVKLSTTVITGKKPTSGAANPELARTGGGVRWCIAEEPNQDEEINIGMLKHLSGNDSFYARDLFEKGKDGREIDPMFKLTIICNKLPVLRFADRATFNRLKVLPFESTFCRETDPAPVDPEEQLRQKRFPMDKTLGERMHTLSSAFAWVLLEHRKTVKERYEPSKVLEATEHYKRINDIYKKYFDENIVEEKEAIMSLNDMYTSFKEWFREGVPNKTVPNKSDVEEYFIRLWGDYDLQPKRWRGYRMRNDKDDFIKDDNGVMWQIEDDDEVINPLMGKN